MRRIPVIALIVLMLALPIPALAQSATPAASPRPRPAATSPGWSTSVAARSTWSATARAAPPSCWWPATARRPATGATISLQPDAPRTMVLPAVAEFTRVCAYDRPGTYASIGEDDFVSRSDPIAQPRTAPEVVAELHALLQAAEIPGPYVLAAHSLGGLFARLYASTYPDEVVGLVLVDAYSERLETLMPPERWEALVRLNQEFGTDTVVPIPGYGDVETMGYGADNAVVREAVAASPLRPMPLAVLAHGKPFPQAAGDAQGFTTGELEASPAGELRRSGHPRPERALHRGHRERPRHPPGSTRAGDRSDPAGGRGRAQPGHLV